MKWIEKEIRGQKGLYSEREGVVFEILDINNRCPVAFVDGTKYGHSSVGIDSVKKWCEDFEYCYECGENMIHTNKLCFKCYFK